MYLQFNYQRPGDNANNGNVHNVYDLLNGNNQQAFTYDKLNGMNTFNGQVNGVAQSRAYTLDRYGNLSDSYNPLAFNTANNRITTTGYGYDNAGNLTTEPQRAYSYDGENRLRLAVVGGITVGQYLYDGEGRRAKRITPQETRYYIHDALGNAVFEYKVNAGYDTFNHFHNGRLTATVTPADNLLWVYSNHLSTPRLKATPTGGALSSDWYEPFGRAINTPADGMKYRFTAKERDPESGLDYFLARYYSGSQRRFTSPDSFNVVLEEEDEEFDAYLSQPQNWNRYSYAWNNPLKYVDPSGKLVELTGSEEDRERALERLKKMVGTTDLGTRTANGRTYVTYTGKGDAAKVLGEFGQMLGEGKTVEFAIASEFSFKNSQGAIVTKTTESMGGGVTVGAEESLSGNIQVVVESNAGSRATNKGKGIWGYQRSRLGNPILYFSNDVVDAHEFGHAWGQFKYGLPIGTYSPATNGYAVDWENRQRASNGWKDRRRFH